MAIPIVVVDTNVFISVLRGGFGAGTEVFRLCLEGELEPLMGMALFHEYEAVMTRKKLFARSPLDADERDELLNAFLSCCRWTKIYYLWRPNLKDESDNHLIELAVAGGAQYIVTKNSRDLTHSELNFPTIKIVTPQKLLKEIRYGDYDC